ncbi:MAG: hypothetical protein Q7R55_01075 [Candidatus Wildermuthbacteria bacterium]|nr:hypothetical protein [Candidatus Wildermuthbacteria bacterium]
MRLWPRKLTKKNALTRLLYNLEYEGFVVGHDHDGYGRPVYDKLRNLLGHVDNTACFTYVRKHQAVPAVHRIIEIVRQLRRQGLAVSLSDGGKLPVDTAA